MLLRSIELSDRQFDATMFLAIEVDVLAMVEVDAIAHHIRLERDAMHVDVVEDVALAWCLHTQHIRMLVLLVAQLQGSINPVLLLLALCPLLLCREFHLKCLGVLILDIGKEEHLIRTPITIHIIELARHILSLALDGDTLHLEVHLLHVRELHHHRFVGLVLLPVIGNGHLHRHALC